MDKSIALVFSIILIFVSCQQPRSEWKGTIEVVDGVVTVKNPEEPINRGDVLNLEEDLSIGAFEGKDEYTFSQINDLDVDDNGNIYGISSVPTLKTKNPPLRT